MYFNTSPYIEIISGINTIFSFSDGVVKLTGPHKTGKTALLHELAEELRSEGMEVVIFATPPKSAEELQDHLVRTLELPADVSFRKALLRHLNIRPRDRQRLILVMDDAELLSVDTLQGICSLRKLENNSQCFINVLLCGAPALDQLLTDASLMELSSDISMQYQLTPLDADQLKKFCGHYLQQIGKAHYRLSPEHLDMLLRDSAGLPGLALEQLGEQLTDPSFLLSLGKPEHVVETSDEETIAPVQPNSLENIRTLLAEGYKDWLKLLSGAAVTLTIASVLYGTSEYWSHYLIGNTPTNEAVGVLPVPTQPQPDVTAVAEPAPTAAPTPTPVPAAAPALQAEPEPESQPTPAPASALELLSAAEPVPVVTVEAASPAPMPAPTIATPAPVQPRPLTVSNAPTEPPAPPAVSAGASALRASVDLWAMAWQSQDVDAYLSAYHSNFTPQYHNSLSSWRNDRIRNITRPASIAIAISDFEVVDTGSEGSSVRFWQEYHSPSYADRTRKELLLSPDSDGQLHILRELNHEVIKLPAGRVTSVTTVDSLPPQPSTPVVRVPGVDSESIVQFINSWLDAWQKKDVAAYLGHYETDYTPDAATSAQAWRSERSIRINRPSFIRLQLVNLAIVEQNAAATLVQITLEYHSNYYADRTTKLLRVQRQLDGDLRIVMERNTLVETLPLVRLMRPTSQPVRAFARTIVEQGH